jgi:hypothetical protein
VDIPPVLVDPVVLARPQPPDDLGHVRACLIVIGSAREHQRYERLVDEHRVGLVDQRHIRRTHSGSSRR